MIEGIKLEITYGGITLTPLTGGLRDGMYEGLEERGALREVEEGENLGTCRSRRRWINDESERERWREEGELGRDLGDKCVGSEMCEE